MPKLANYVVTLTGGNKATVRLPAFLNDANTNVLSSLGIDVATAANSSNVPGPFDLSDILKSGQLVRIAITYGTTTARKKASLVCDLNNLATALSNLPGKQYKGQTILTAYMPRRVRLG